MAALNIRKEILDLISVNEKIQSALLKGESLREASSSFSQKLTPVGKESHNQGCQSS